MEKDLVDFISFSIVFDAASTVNILNA